MNVFLDAVPLALTPLTPIHIGCGQDFEPTNYVIDDGVLYYFDPARLTLTDKDRSELIAAVSRSGDEAIRATQKFFHVRKDRLAAIAHGAVSVAAGVAQQYDQRIGQIAQQNLGGQRIANLLEIERTAHHPHTGAPYIPGSSLKGAMRTAWLDSLNKGSGKNENESAQNMEKRLLNSSAGFQADPFRLLRVADAAGTGVQTKVVFSTNHKKRLVHDKDGRVVFAKGPSTRRESILGGQYRGIAGEIRFEPMTGMNVPGRTPEAENRIPGFTELAQACNRFYLRKLRELIDVLDSRGFADPSWLSGLRQLIEALHPSMERGEIMLLRVGRHSGAECVTIDGVRLIRIMKGHGQPADFSPDGSKTVWLAAEREGERSGMLPFGWLLLEPAGVSPCPELERWCADHPKSNLAEVHGRLEEAKRAAVAETELRCRREAEQIAEEQARLDALAAREAARAELSAEGRLVVEFIDLCEKKLAHKRKDPLNPGSGLYGNALSITKAALASDSPWSPADRHALAEALEFWLPQVIERLDRKDDMKEARKRLKLAALRGE